MRYGLFIACSLTLAASVALAEEELKPSQQAMLLLRILSFDRNLASRAAGELKIAVVFRLNDSDSEAVRSEMIRALDEAAKHAVGLRMQIKIERLPFTTQGGFESDLATMKPAALYVAPGLSSQIGSISRATRKHGVLTFAGTESYVRSGLSVGLIVRDSKPGMIVNLPASRAEGADLSAEMLQLAEVIR